MFSFPPETSHSLAVARWCARRGGSEFWSVVTGERHFCGCDRRIHPLPREKLGKDEHARSLRRQGRVILGPLRSMIGAWIMYCACGSIRSRECDNQTGQECLLMWTKSFIRVAEGTLDTLTHDQDARTISKARTVAQAQRCLRLRRTM
jgi:hypothetical protein